MKKNSDNNNSLQSDLYLGNETFTNHFKTTNVNILLNRVKIEKKNDFKKKIYLSSILILIISSFLAFVISI